MSKKKINLQSLKRQLILMFRVGKQVFLISPITGIVQFLDSVISTIIPIITTFLAAKTTTLLVDAYANNPQAQQEVVWYVVATSAMGILSITWKSVSGYIQQKTHYVIETTLEDRLIRHFSLLPFYMYDDKEIVDMHEKARRFSTGMPWVFSRLGSIMASFVGVIGSIIALASVSIWLALVILVAVLPGALLQLQLTRKQMQHWEGNITNRRRKGNIGWTLQKPSHIAEMRVYGVIDTLIKIHADLRDKDQKERMNMELSYTWSQLGSKVLAAVIELGSLLWIVFEIIHRSQPVGQFVLVQQLVSRAIAQAEALASQLGNADEDFANIIDYQRYMELKTESQDGKDMASVPGEICCNDVSFVYPKTKIKVLSDVSFCIKKGQHVAIVGENGAGKSTLVKLLMGLYKPTSGNITVDGVSLNDTSLRSWHAKIGLLSQDFIEYDFGTMRENITLGDVKKRPTTKAIKEAMDAAEFSEIAKKYKNNIDTYIARWMVGDDEAESATELSGGQSQRLALARSFYRDSPIVILDEPTSAIDALAESRIFARLFKSDKTIITISHRYNTVAKADVIYMLEEGKIVESGTAKELVQKRGAFYKMFESQIQ